MAIFKPGDPVRVTKAVTSDDDPDPMWPLWPKGWTGYVVEIYPKEDGTITYWIDDDGCNGEIPEEYLALDKRRNPKLYCPECKEIFTVKEMVGTLCYWCDRTDKGRAVLSEGKD